MDLTSYFKDMKAYSETQISTGSSFSENGTILNLCSTKNLGTVSIRPILDEKGVPMKPVHNIYEVYQTFPRLDENGQQMVDDKGKALFTYKTTLVGTPELYQNILALTPEQVGILVTLRSKLQEYMDYCKEGVIAQEDTDDQMGVKYRSEITFFWGKVFSINTANGTSGTEGYVRLCRHHSTYFFSNFTDALQAQTDARKDGGAWMAGYFNRNPGDDQHTLSISTKLAKGFETQFNFVPDGQKYTLTQDDINTAVDLNSVGYAVTQFNTEDFTTLLNSVNANIELAKKYAAEASGVTQVANPAAQYQQALPQTGATPTSVPNPVNAAAAQVPPTTPVQPTVDPTQINFNNMQPTQVAGAVPNMQVPPTTAPVQGTPVGNPVGSVDPNQAALNAQVAGVMMPPTSL